MVVVIRLEVDDETRRLVAWRNDNRHQRPMKRLATREEIQAYTGGALASELDLLREDVAELRMNRT